MKLGFAQQYSKACVIIEVGDSPAEVINFAEENEAIYFEGPDPIQDKTFVVQFPGRPKELYTQRALERSFRDLDRVG